MSPTTQLQEFEESTTITETVRERVREAIIRINTEQPERALMFIPFENIEGMTSLSEAHLMMVLKQFEGYAGSLDEALELTANNFKLYPFYLSRHIEVLMLTDRFMAVPELQLAEEVTLLASQKAERHKRRTSFSLVVPVSVTDYYKEVLTDAQKTSFRTLLRELLALEGLSITGKVILPILQIKRGK